MYLQEIGKSKFTFSFYRILFFGGCIIRTIMRYMQSMVKVHNDKPARNIKSVNLCELVETNLKLTTYGEPSLSIAPHKVWTNLPVEKEQR